MKEDKFNYALGAAGLKPCLVGFVRNDMDGYIDYMSTVTGGEPSHFSPKELITPVSHQLLVKEVTGGRWLLPGAQWWPRLALLRWAADGCRFEEPVRMAWAWRPTLLNDAVGGHEHSAHLTCCAIDLDFSSLMARNMALRRFLHPLWNSPVNFGLGLGVGQRRVHIDFFSPRWEEIGKPRWWRYETAADYDGPKRPI